MGAERMRKTIISIAILGDYNRPVSSAELAELIQALRIDFQRYTLAYGLTNIESAVQVWNENGLQALPWGRPA
jgi:hypothetical protein